MLIPSTMNLNGLSVLGSTINKVVVQNPFVTAVGLTSMKTAAADLFVQTIKIKSRGLEEEEEGMEGQIDLQRVAVFGLYGALYMGAFQFFLFTRVYPKLFPLAQRFAQKSFGAKLKDPVGGFVVMKQVTVEAFLHWPLLLVPMYYVFQEFVTTIVSAGGRGKGKSKMMIMTNLRRSIREKIKSNWWDDLKLCWLIWLPASLCNFSTLPLEWQVPFTTLVSFFYTTVLSLRRGGDNDQVNTKKDL